MVLVDSHCHLDMLKNHDSYDNIIKRADIAGVKYLQTICTKLESLKEILAIAEKYDNVFVSAGIHPSEVKQFVTAEELIEVSNNKKIIGLGETGLDYYYNKDIKQQDMQRLVFAEHIKASSINGLPIIVHTRAAEEDTYNIIADYKKNDNFSGLIHCFTASRDFARKILDLDLYISIAGIVTFKNAEDLKDIVKFIPLDRILVETDSPYLAPVPMRGKTNEPAFTKYVAQIVADLKKVSFEECAAQTTANFFRLFKNAKPD